jgi:hypothetical protein
MEEKQRRIAKAAIEAAPAANQFEIVARMSGRLALDPIEVKEVLDHLLSEQVLSARVVPIAGNVAAGDVPPTFPKLFYEKGAEWVEDKVKSLHA